MTGTNKKSPCWNAKPLQSLVLCNQIYLDLFTHVEDRTVTAETVSNHSALEGFHKQWTVQL
jgi:hypothetical protein